ncbi:hypothetical protein Y09_0809 [Brachybacterium sp. SW0106-09]|nr:hypothetical protein Y09_0809 [Brachybacterium sp. SW0106-09]
MSGLGGADTGTSFGRRRPGASPHEWPGRVEWTTGDASLRARHLAPSEGGALRRTGATADRHAPDIGIPSANRNEGGHESSSPTPFRDLTAE